MTPADQDEKPKPSSPASALSQLFELASHMWTPLQTPLPQRKRFGFAFAGSLSWVFYNSDPYWLNVIESLPGAWLLPATAAMQIVIGAWFAWLISYQARHCSPSRFFLERLLFPGVAGALLTAGSPFAF